MSSDRCAMTVNTLIPAALLDGLEGRLLMAMMKWSEPEPGMIYFYSEEGPYTADFPDEGSLSAAIDMAERSRSPLAALVLPAMRDTLASGDLDLGVWLGPLDNGEGPSTSVDVVDILAALVDANQEALPFVEVEYARVGSKPSPQAFGGGAYFITPGKVEQVNSHRWLTERRAELAGPAAPRP